MAETELEASHWAQQLLEGGSRETVQLAGVLWRLRQAAGLVTYGGKRQRFISAPERYLQLVEANR